MHMPYPAVAYDNIIKGISMYVYNHAVKMLFLALPLYKKKKKKKLTGGILYVLYSMITQYPP